MKISLRAKKMAYDVVFGAELFVQIKLLKLTIPFKSGVVLAMERTSEFSF